MAVDATLMPATLVTPGLLKNQKFAKMKHHQPPTYRRHLLPGSAAALSLLLVSCKLPPRQTWNMVQERGLIPVLMASNPDPAPNPVGRQVAAAAVPAPAAAPSAPLLARKSAPSRPVLATTKEENAPLRVQAVKQPEIAKIPFATPVPGRSGYVFSPHTTNRKVVDVRQYAPGAEVRCPFTMKSFSVPDFAAIAAASPAPRPKPQRSVAEVASRSTERLSDRAPATIPDLPTPPPAPPTQADIPYGSRVPGRAGFVYSPFAEKNQLVDVAGIAPGVEVKCPYSNKLFRVPEPSPEEIAPAPAPATVIPQPQSIPGPPPAPEPAPAPSSKPTPSQGSVAPAPTPAPASDETPIASWSDKAKNLVQSPFGSTGQLIDVSGRAAGSKMSCPFTNKEFIIPTP